MSTCLSEHLEELGGLLPVERAHARLQLGGHVVHDPGKVVDGVQVGGQHDYGTGTRFVWIGDPGPFARSAR